MIDSISFVFEGSVCKTAVLCILPERICICTDPCIVSLTLIQVCSDKKKVAKINSALPNKSCGTLQTNPEKY